MQEATRLCQRLMRQRNAAHRRANARTDQAQFRIATLGEPIETPSRVRHGLPVRLQRQADVRSHQMIGPLVARNRAAVMIGQAHAQDTDAKLVQPPAEAQLAIPFRIPVWQQHHGGAVRTCRKESCDHAIVLGPGRTNAAREG